MKTCYKCQSGDHCPAYTLALSSLSPFTSTSGLKLKESDVILAERLKCSESTAMACDKFIDKTKKRRLK
jgi:hypothetical protein